MASRPMLVQSKCKNNIIIITLKKKTSGQTKEKLKNSLAENQSPVDDERSVGSSNAFEATENLQKDSERELSDEELDDLIDGDK
jgi:hypothetical protein